MKGRITGLGETARYFIDGKEVTRAEFDAAFPDVVTAANNAAGITAWRRPVVSQGMAFHKSQVEEAREFFHKRGISGAEVQSDGKVVFRDRGSRKRALKAQGMHDNDGGYGDG